MISLCGAGGVCETINENWLAACRIKDQLQPQSPLRRIYNPLCCGLGSFGFNVRFDTAAVVNNPGYSRQGAIHIRPLPDIQELYVYKPCGTQLESCTSYTPHD